MSRIAWLNGSFVDPDAGCLSIDDPGARSGVGLFETLRCQDGRLPLLARHLARIERSGVALGLAGAPAAGAIADAAGTVAAALGPGPARVRITVTPHPTLLVEGEPISPDPDMTLTAAAILGAWHPGRRVAEHKTLSFIELRDAQRRAEEAGADIALLLDWERRLGEASTANVFCVIDGSLITTPVDGILPGVTRSLILETAGATEEPLTEPAWRGADEMFVSSAVRGVVPVTVVDGTPVGPGRPGPVTVRVAEMVLAALTGEYGTAWP